MRSTLASLLVGIVSLQCVAADNDPVRAPYVEVGDCWSYRAERLYNHGWISGYEICVTHVDRAKDVIFATAKVRDDGREIDVSYTLQWGCRFEIGGTLCDPPTNSFDFPLHVGDRKSVDFISRTTAVGSHQGNRQAVVEVVGWEDVTVPAGTFHALKIVSVGYNYRYDGVGRIAWTMWYVPEINRHVKFMSVTTPSQGSWSEELTGYRLNK